MTRIIKTCLTIINKINTEIVFITELFDNKIYALNVYNFYVAKS